INLPRISCLNTSVSEAVALALTREEAKRRKDDAERKGVVAMGTVVGEEDIG
ncbi:hypothetical protein Pmar_PMAR024329, partial [Perkinsus marinus ATCC 50983]